MGKKKPQPSTGMTPEESSAGQGKDRHTSQKQVRVPLTYWDALLILQRQIKTKDGWIVSITELVRRAIEETLIKHDIPVPPLEEIDN